MSAEKFYGTGKRKTSVAKVWMNPGEGRIVANGKDLKAYLGTDYAAAYALYPLEVTDLQNKFDLKISVAGGGVAGQAGAIRRGLSLAMLQADPNLRIVLKQAGLLTRDSRVKERKKYGQKGARAKFQFSKR
ncbi:MAG: 30S ribosomal protein S9 [Nitrospinota bacterium]